MKQFVKCSFNILIKNWPTLLAFDMVYKAFSYSILYSVISDLLSLILKTGGVSYLSSENLSALLHNPISVLLCLCLIFITMLSAFFETVALYVYCEAGWQQQHISIAGLLKKTMLHCKKLFHIQNLLLFLGFILSTILTILPFSPYVLQWLSIPEFIMYFVKQNTLLFSVFLVVSVIANLICFLFLFFLPNTLFQNQSMIAAWKNGFHLLKKRKFITLFRIAAAFVIFGLVMLFISSVIFIGLVYFTKLTESPLKVVETFMVYFYRAVSAVVFIISSLSATWLFSLLITLFHQYRGDNRPSATAGNKAGIRYHFKLAGVIMLTIAAILMFCETELGVAFMDATYVRPQVVAHRGSTKFAPENTMAALEKAISTGIDMVEIDVQQLKDGHLILLHDNSFGRTTGENNHVWEVGYDEVRHYDAGSRFAPKFAGEPIPTLDNILKRAKGNIQVMIELKLTGRETNLVKEVIALIEKYEMLDQCNIGSLNLELLKEVKSTNPNIKTVYITPLIYSGQYDIGFIDAFSVETTFLTREMVASMHMQQKKVYSWTANSKETIEKNLKCQVDGIVTDDPELVMHYAMQTWHRRLLSLFVRNFFAP